jgi:hypothetical protein
LVVGLFANCVIAGEAEQFFTSQVLPRLATDGCVKCHSPGPGYVTPAISYDGLLPYLAMGQARDNNVLIYKIANQRSFAPDRPAHIGGRRCKSEAAEPCATLMRWWDLEFGGKP